MSLNKLGRYDIIRVLGKGAMGLVYEARDPNLDRRVAIKTIKVENLSPDASIEYEARFRTEARSAARLQHPNIVSVYDSGRHGDVAYLVIEFVQGEDLKHHLDGGRLFTFEQSLRMVGDLLSALDYAHRQNIVHRDVKPANLLIETDGRVKLTDFGVARIQDAGEATHTKGSMVGTLKYMSPEQVQGQPVDARSDLFAAAIVLYQLLTGRRPFDGDTEFAIIQQIVGATPAPPSAINPRLPPAVDVVMARALAKKPEQRFQSAREFAQALREASGQVADLTIVPPAGAASVRAGTATSRPGDPGDDSVSTIRQEIELVYWKDVRQSNEVEDLELFLGKFPSGIYADLARRRLKMLANPPADMSMQVDTTPLGIVPRRSTEQTQLQAREEATLAATRAMPARAASSADHQEPTGMDTATVPRPGRDADKTSVMVKPSEPPAAPPAVEAAPLPVVEALAATTDQSPASGRGEAVDQPPVDRRQVRRSSLPWLALGGMVVLAAVGLAFKLMPGAETPAAVTAPSPVATQLPASAAAQPAQPVAAAAPAVAVSEPAKTAPKAPASAALVKPVPQRTAISNPLPIESPAAQVSEQAPAPVPKPVAPEHGASLAAPVTAPLTASGPAQACEGRVLLGFQVCMNEQCAKPGFANHPVCVERRAAEQMRLDAVKSNERR